MPPRGLPPPWTKVNIAKLSSVAPNAGLAMVENRVPA